MRLTDVVLNNVAIYAYVIQPTVIYRDSKNDVYAKGGSVFIDLDKRLQLSWVSVTDPSYDKKQTIDTMITDIFQEMIS